MVAALSDVALKMLLLESPTNTALLQIELSSSADYSSILWLWDWKCVSMSVPERESEGENDRVQV